MLLNGTVLGTLQTRSIVQSREELTAGASQGGHVTSGRTDNRVFGVLQAHVAS